VALGAGGKAWTLNCHNGGLLMGGNIQFLGRLKQNVAGAFAECRKHRQVANTTWTLCLAVVEGLQAFGGPVDEIVWHNQVARLDFLAQGATGRGHNQVGAAHVAQSPDVGAVVDIGGHDVVLAAMSREEHALDSVDFALDQGIRRFSVGRLHHSLLAMLQDIGVVESRSANDPNLWNGFVKFGIEKCLLNFGKP